MKTGRGNITRKYCSGMTIPLNSPCGESPMTKPLPPHVYENIMLSQLRKLEDAIAAGLPALKALACTVNDSRRQGACKDRANYIRRVDGAGDAWIINTKNGNEYLQGMSRDGDHSYPACMCADHAYTYAINHALVTAGNEPLVLCRHGHLNRLKANEKPSRSPPRSIAPPAVSRPVHATYPRMLPFLAYTPTSGERESDLRQGIEDTRRDGDFDGWVIGKAVA